MPTGIVVQCQNDRSQHKNKATAMKQLKAKLYELEMQKRNAEAQALEDTKSDIGWGNQIRSYVLDQSRIKDLRTGVEVGNTQAVLDGDLDQFIEASLKQGALACRAPRAGPAGASEKEPKCRSTRTRPDRERRASSRAARGQGQAFRTTSAAMRSPATCTLAFGALDPRRWSATHPRRGGRPHDGQARDGQGELRRLRT
jgi:hypothetical protein